MEITPFSPLKILRHADRVEARARGETVYPVSVELDVSNTCPHDCPFCSFGTSTSQGYRQQTWVQFPLPRLLTLIRELADCGVKSVTFTGGGEPLVHRGIAAAFEAATDAGLSWGVVSNGFLLRGPAQDWIARHATFCRVSLDAGCSETHARTHGLPPGQYQFAQILDNLQHTRVKAGSRLTLGASFCVMPENWREIYQAAQLVKEHGANYLEVRPTYPTDWRGDGWEGRLTEEELDGARHEVAHARTHLDDATFRVIGMVERFERLVHPTKDYTRCRIDALTTVIGADGRGWQCCVQRGMEGFTWGSVLERPFAEVWRDHQRLQMVDAINVRTCPRCRYDSLNEIIEHGILADGLHAQFV